MRVETSPVEAAAMSVVELCVLAVVVSLAVVLLWSLAEPEALPVVVPAIKAEPVAESLCAASEEAVVVEDGEVVVSLAIEPLALVEPAVASLFATLED